MAKFGSPVRKRSVVVVDASGKMRKTSVSLEEEFWDHVHRIAQNQKITISAFVSDVYAARPYNLSSAIRLRVLKQYAPR